MILSQNSQLFYEFASASANAKADPAFGKRLADEIINLAEQSGDSYFERRNEVIRLNEMFAMGTQDMREYLDFLNIDGKESYVNLDMAPPDIASPFIERIVARCMERDERPTVTCVDDESFLEKQRRKAEAEFRMMMAQEIAAMQEQAGVPLEDPQAFVPQDQDDLELWSETEDRLPQEVAFEKKIYDVLMDSGYQVFKRRVLNDFTIAGFACAKVFLDSNKHIKYKFIDPKRVIYAYSEYDDFRDSNIIGHLERMKVSDFRQLYPNVPEDKVFEYFRQTSYNAEFTALGWNDSYYTDYHRPYDDAIIELFQFEYITNDTMAYTKKTTGNGREIVKMGYGKGDVIAKRHWVVYEGCYVIGSNEMVSWSVQKNMIKPMQAIHEVFTSYVLIMPNQRRMIAKPLVSKMIRHIRQMTISLLKLQQLKSQLRPDEIAVDVTALQEMDLGLGRAMTPFEVQKIFQQTGVAYYKGKSDDDETRNGPPFTPLPMSSTPAKMQILMEDYNFHLQLLRNDIGTNEIADGQGFNSKLGLGVQNNLIGTSNRSTEFIYEAFVNMLEGIAKRVAVLMWHSVVGGGPYAMAMAGQEVSRRVFDVQITMLPTDVERQYIEGLVSTSLSAGLITFEEAFKVRRLSKINVKLAELYLAKYEKKRQAQRQQESLMNIEATAKAQQESNQQTHDNQKELEKLKGKNEKDKQMYIGMADRTKQMGEIVKLMLENPAAAQSMGQAGAQLIALYMQNLGQTQALETLNSEVEQSDKAKEEEQKEQMEAMAEQEAMMQASQANGELQNMQ